MTIRLGALPEWLAAIGTVGAFGVALRLLWRDQQDRRVAQARRVFAWHEGINTQLHGVMVAVENRSDELVYELYVGFDGGGIAVVSRIGHVPPGRSQHTLRLPPAMELPRGEVDIAIRFTDGTGRLWKREGRGRLYNPSADEVFIEPTSTEGGS